MNLSEMINVTLSVPRTLNYSTNSSGVTNQVVPESDFHRTFGMSMNEMNSQFENVEGETFYRNFYECVNGARTPAEVQKIISLSCQYAPTNRNDCANDPSTTSTATDDAAPLSEEPADDSDKSMTKNIDTTNEFYPPMPMKKTSPWRLIIQEGDVLTSSPVYRKPSVAYKKDKDRSGFVNFLAGVGWDKGMLPGQEYLVDLYEIARSRSDPMLLESLESFLCATVEGLRQKQSDNDELDTALKMAMEKNAAIAMELQAEMEHQVAMLEKKIREEELVKLEDLKQDAETQIEQAHRDLKEMERKVKDLEEEIESQKGEVNIPEVVLEEIQNKEKENAILQQKLIEFQTQMALMRTEVAQMKAVYEEQAERLASERGTVLTCVSEQENLTRQLHLLHEANKRLHDTNDDLRSALDKQRSSSSFGEDTSSVFQRNSFHSSFRSDPGGRRIRPGNSDFSNIEMDEEAKTPILCDQEGRCTPITSLNQIPPLGVNETPLLAELMAVDNTYPYDSPIPIPKLSEPVSTVSKEPFVKQLEILCETNKRLGESNDELRCALGLLSGQIRMDQEMMRCNSVGCQSAPITPMRKTSLSERPHSSAAPRRVLLTKYHTTSSLGTCDNQTDDVLEDDDIEDEELVRLIDQANEDDDDVTDGPIFIEEKIIREPGPIEPRGDAVGADSAVADTMLDRATPDRMYKLVLAGNAAVGKSSFIIRLCRDKFYSALNSTLGVDFQMKTIECDGSKVALQLWDTAGQERFRSIAKSYFRRVDGVILLYDVTCENSFCDVRDWLESIQSSNSTEVPVILCGNKTDLRPDAIRNGTPVVSWQQGQNMAEDVNALFIETSAKDGTNINKACLELTRKLLKIDDEQIRDDTIVLEEKEKPKMRCCPLT